MTVGPVDNDGIPEPVAEQRQALIDRAVECDFRGITELARSSNTRVVIDGADVPPRRFRALEEDGQPVLRYLAGLLGLAHHSDGSGADRTFTWPSAVGWPFADVAPGDERAALVGVVGEDGIFGWSETGGYAGWRTTIGADGTWQSFSFGPAED
jgi:hypothetical protein